MRVGVIHIAKADLVDDPCNKIQLQTELRIYYIYIYIKEVFLHALRQIIIRITIGGRVLKIYIFFCTSLPQLAKANLIEARKST